MDKISVAYGNYIREHRKKIGLSQADVAKRLGISQQAYGRYEQGLREPTFSFIINISHILDYDPGEFFDNYRG